MLIKESHIDVETIAEGVKGSMRIFLFHPTIPGYSRAKFPGVVLFSEIYQVTGPVARFARQIASHGYIVGAPSSYHDFTGPMPLAYDTAGTATGNEYKIRKRLCSYDADAAATITTLVDLATCTGRIGTTGMCLGGHLAYRCALDARVAAAVLFFATDLHSATLGAGMADDSLRRASEIRAELACIHGTADPHVPAEGRDLIRHRLRESRVVFSWYEVAGAQHAFIRDELSKDRYDAAITKVCFEILLELFNRTLKTERGPHDGGVLLVDDVC